MSKFLPLIWNSICFYFILITRFGCESNFRDGLHKDRSLCVWPIYNFFLLPLPVCYHKLYVLCVARFDGGEGGGMVK